LEAREDAIPSRGEAYLVIDSSLLVQAMSSRAQSFLAQTEEVAINRPVGELLVPADAEGQGHSGFASAIADAAVGRGDETTHKTVRPWNTFGVRMQARIATCGPPRAALVVLEDSGPRALRAVKDR
jgi:hypothetical protein